MIFTTKSKIALEKYVSRFVIGARRACNLPPIGSFRRGNLIWSLDLTEGIDFSIYFLGSFEPSLVAFYKKRIHPGQTILDIGANIGAHTLHFAHAVGSSGSVIAIEATDYAYRKLQINIDLNPAIRSRVTARQILLAASVASEKPAALHASWPLDNGHKLHAIHQGELKSVDGARVLALDQLIIEEKVAKVDWIKLDVDGNELSVLQGASAVLRDMQPRLLMELAPSCYEDFPRHFDELIDLLLSQDYALYSVPQCRPLPFIASRLRKLIPVGASINVMLVPKGKSIC